MALPTSVALAAACFVALAGCAAGPETEACPAEFSDPPCKERITEAEARRLALQAGLGPGLNPWECKFYFYYRDRDHYVWSVANTTAQGGEGQTSHANGSTVLLDGATGNVLEVSTWYLVA